MFHATSGWFWDRQADGSVRIMLEPSHDADLARVKPRDAVVLDADTWISIVTHMSAEANRTSRAVARALHKGDS